MNERDRIRQYLKGWNDHMMRRLPALDNPWYLQGYKDSKNS